MFGLVCRTGLNQKLVGTIIKAKEELQDIIHKNIHGVRWDFPDPAGKGGTTTTGNTSCDLLHSSINQEIILVDISEQLTEPLSVYGQHISVIPCVLSSLKVVNVERYKYFCTELYLHLLDNFPLIHNQHLSEPWISIMPSLDKLLAQSWELILNNNCEGLQRLDESGLEGCNKILRKIRTNLSRMTSQLNNLTDTIALMWVGSDEFVQIERKKALPYCNSCRKSGHGTSYCPKWKCVDTAISLDNFLFDLLNVQYIYTFNINFMHSIIQLIIKS